MRLQKEMHIVVDPLPLSLQKPKNKFLSSISPISANSSPQSLESPSKVSNLTHKKQHLQWRSMSLSKKQGTTTHQVEQEHENRHQGSFSKDSGKKVNALCMCVPGFGKPKPVKARKGGIQMMDPVMSSTFSLENFELKPGITQGKGITVQENDYEDNSISSYFDLPSIVLKCSGDGA
ncbi:hypothetical protein VNO77_23566 [Canavalia gladiata]|uniref:Uncharacterized protein n=1 Tax=Canavalia gladiata TaxID=3824 RepID=A0AAN9L551_CANGL